MQIYYVLYFLKYGNQIPYINKPDINKLRCNGITRDVMETYTDLDWP